MWWHDVLRALALVMVFEGLMPFLMPHRFRELLIRLMSLDERALRTAGFACVLIGVLALEVMHWLF